LPGSGNSPLWSGCARPAETGWPCYPYFANDPNLATLHGDPGYEAFMRELKAQWERFQLTL